MRMEESALSLLQQLKGAWPGTDVAGRAFALPTSSPVPLATPSPKWFIPVTQATDRIQTELSLEFLQFRCLKCVTTDLLFPQGPFKCHPFYEGFISLDKINPPPWCP